jgi:hypothetical protein
MTAVAPQQPPPPLPPFPPAPESSKMTLPGGGQLVGMVDLPKGMNDDCHVNFNLMLQLGPFLGATECLVKVLNLCAWIIEFVQDVPQVVTRPDKLIDKLTELPPIADGVLKCVTDWSPIGICAFVKDILKMISSFLGCILELLQSIMQQQVGLQIKMGQAQGNPALLEVLDASQKCTEVMTQQAMNSCAPVFTTLKLVEPFLEMVGAGGMSLPSLDNVTGGAAEPVITVLSDVKSIIDAVIATLPC